MPSPSAPGRVAGALQVADHDGRDRLVVIDDQHLRHLAIVWTACVTGAGRRSSPVGKGCAGRPFSVGSETVSAVLDIVLPCLDEARALPWVLDRIPAGARADRRRQRLHRRSADIAARPRRARASTCQQRGYGAACHAGLQARHGRVRGLLRLRRLARPGRGAGASSTCCGPAPIWWSGRRVPTGRRAWPVHARLANLELARRVRRRTGARAARRRPAAGRPARRPARRWRSPTGAAATRSRRWCAPAQAGWRIVGLDVAYTPRTGRSKVTGTVRGTLQAVRDMSAVLAAVTRAARHGRRAGQGTSRAGQDPPGAAADPRAGRAGRRRRADRHAGPVAALAGARRVLAFDGDRRGWLPGRAGGSRPSPPAASTTGWSPPSPPLGRPAGRAGRHGHPAAAGRAAHRLRPGALRRLPRPRPPTAATGRSASPTRLRPARRSAACRCRPTHTGAAQLRGCAASGLRVQLLDELTDVDTIDAAARGRPLLAPGPRFARALRRRSGRALMRRRGARAVRAGAARPGPARAAHRRRPSIVELDVARWLAAADDADDTVLDRCTGPVLDVGCGPGRFVSSLDARGVAALGVDIAETAVALTRGQGMPALLRDVFHDLPGEGRWPTVLLMDGNIGIGGDPARLLARIARAARARAAGCSSRPIRTTPRTSCSRCASAWPATRSGPSFAWAARRAGRAAALRRRRRATRRPSRGRPAGGPSSRSPPDGRAAPRTA